MKISKRFLACVIMVLLCVLLAVGALALNRGAEFGGSDDAATDAIAQTDPDYEPWAESVIELPSSEVESLLFCVQSVIGSGIIFFCFGYLAARKKYRPESAEMSAEMSAEVSADTSAQTVNAAKETAE
jgi:cobalt/nickel transport protein